MRASTSPASVKRALVVRSLALGAKAVSMDMPYCGDRRLTSKAEERLELEKLGKEFDTTKAL